MSSSWVALKNLGRVLDNKSIKLGIQAPDGRELNLEASSYEDLEFARQLAEDFVKKTKNTQDSKDGEGSTANRG